MISYYNTFEAVDIERLYEIARIFNINDKVSFSVSDEDKEKIIKLYNAYEKAVLKEELKKKIDEIYFDYIEKDISEIEESDIEKIKTLILYFDEAEEKQIDLGEYDKDYIRHLYNDYDIYNTSENIKTIDISKYYDIDMLAVPGETASPDIWYECDDNLNGDFFRQAKHSNIKEYKDNILSMKEYKYVETSNYDENTGITTVTYPYTPTERTIDFYMPNSIFSAGVCDAVLINTGAKEEYTFSLDGAYTESIYFMISSRNQSTVEPEITYVDGTKETVKISVHTTGQTVNEVRNNRNTYPDMVSYTTSGDYKDYNLAVTGVIYPKDGNTTNGFSVFALPANKDKGVKSITFKSTTAAYSLMGVSYRPLSNIVVIENVNNLYSEVVNGGSIDTSDMTLVSSLVMAYNDAEKRGLYFENIDKDIMSKLNSMVLTFNANIFRYDISTVKVTGEFSVPVNEDTVKNGITVISDGNKVSGVQYILDDNLKDITIDIPVDRYGQNTLNIKIDKITIKDYPNISIAYPYEEDYTVSEYFTLDYSDNSILKVTNNSQVDENVLAYVTVMEDGKVKMTSEKTDTVKAGETKNIYIDSSASITEKSKVSAGVINKDTFRPLAEFGEYEKTGDLTDKQANFKEPVLDLVTNILKIHGITPSKQENKVISAAVYDSFGTLLYIGETAANSDGYFLFNIPVDESNIKMSGYLEIKLGGDDFNELYKIDDVYFPMKDTRIEIVNGLKNAGSIEELELLLNDVKEKLSLNFAPFVELLENETSKKKLAKAIYDAKSEIPSISDSDTEFSQKIVKVQTLIKQLSILVCISENRKDNILSDGVLLYNDIMRYDSIDVNGVTLYKLYTENTSKTGQEAVIDSIIEKNFKEVDELYNALLEPFMLNALKYPAKNGVAHVSKVLTKKNADAVGIDITKYLNLSDTSSADKDIANMNIQSLNDVEDYIKKLGSNNSSNNNGGGGGGNSSSGRTESTGTVSVIPTQPIANQTELEKENESNINKSIFTDIDKSHWAYSAIENLASKNILNGVGDGRFCPDNTITRAEFVKILCMAKGIEQENSQPLFDDVDINAWYAPFIIAAYNKGIITGVTDTLFNPNENISRQDICTILYRMDNLAFEGDCEFTDKDDIAEYAQNAVAYCFNKKIVSGFPDGSFAPGMSCTRAQAATIINNYLNNQQ